MACSSTTPRNWEYDVFTSFHGPDVRKTFLSHLHKQFDLNGITFFDDNGMERSQIIGTTLTNAIRQSSIFIVVLSKKFASSSWCLNELLEILKCNENGQRVVIPVFHGVDPSDVRKQAGDFGIAFNETCALKTKEQKREWSQALTHVANISGEDLNNWENEAKMIEKIARYVSNKLNVTPSKDFDGMVGLEAHLKKVESLLDLGNDGMVKIVGISGPAGIGKSTIAKALLSRLSNRFQHTCFVDNLDEINLAKNGWELHLHKQLLSKILSLDGMEVDHLGVMKQRLHNKKVLIVLDDVEHLEQLETLANTDCFGHGSRVVVTTESKKILQQHGIDDIYHVGFPSSREALMIFCRYAFGQTSPPDELMDVADKVASICGKLPLGLKVLGSSMRGKSQADWVYELPRLKICLDGRIESALKVGYERLNEKDQSLFLYIAVFFNNKHVNYVTSMLAKINSDVEFGLKVLANKHLIHIDGGQESKVVMHCLLQLMARQVISGQEPWKRQILVDALDNANVNGSIIGVSFDVAKSQNLMISVKALKKMCNLSFLKVYNGWHCQEIQFHIPEDFEFPSCLRLLHWEAYQKKSLPLGFCPENLIELKMECSLLEKLWEGTKRLANLKKMNVIESSRLTKLPDLSEATNLETLIVSDCTALLELPSSISNLHKLVVLWLDDCKSVEVIPSLINLVSLEAIHMGGCSRLRNFPNIGITNRVLKYIDVSDSVNLKTFLTDLPTSVEYLFLSNSGVERITDCIKDLQNLLQLELSSCKRLLSLPELPSSLKYLHAENCESLERVSGPLITPNAELYFSNCFKLDREARQTIIQRSFATGFALLPVSEVPAEFNHRARGKFLTIPHTAFNRFKVCLVISPFCTREHHFPKSLPRSILLHLPLIDSHEELESKHLLIYQDSLPFIDPFEFEESRKVVLDFGCLDFYIIECGIQILRDETDGDNNWGSGNEDSDNDLSDTYESYETSDEGEESEKEDDEEGYESESEETLEEKDEDIYRQRL